MRQRSEIVFVNLAIIDTVLFVKVSMQLKNTLLSIALISTLLVVTVQPCDAKGSYKFFVLGKYSEPRIQRAARYWHRDDYRSNAPFVPNYFYEYENRIVLQKTKVPKIDVWIEKRKDGGISCSFNYPRKNSSALKSLSPMRANKLWGKAMLVDENCRTYVIKGCSADKGVYDCFLEVEFEKDAISRYRIRGTEVSTSWMNPAKQ